MEYYSFLYRTAETDVTTVECTTPAGQMYRFDVGSVDILGDMYDRVTAVQGR